MSESTVLTDVENGEFQESCRISAGNGSISKTTLRGGLSEGVDLVDLLEELQRALEQEASKAGGTRKASPGSGGHSRWPVKSPIVHTTTNRR